MQAKVVEAAERHFRISHVTWEYIRMMLVNYFGDPFNEHIWTMLFHELLHRDKPAFSMKPAKRFVLVL